MSLSGANKKSLNMWEMLKKDARKIEGELEMKLSQYSRLSAMDSSGYRRNEGTRALQGASQIEAEIPALLKRLEEVHTSMEADVSGSDIRHHTVARHREILQDFKQEFHRLSHQVGLVLPPETLSRTDGLKHHKFHAIIEHLIPAKDFCAR
jgi:golgi SNAP receptor complex member 1